MDFAFQLRYWTPARRWAFSRCTPLSWNLYATVDLTNDLAWGFQRIFEESKMLGFKCISKSTAAKSKKLGQILPGRERDLRARL